MNPFEALLQAITDPTDREALSGLATRNPDLNRFIADPNRIEFANRMETWANENWDSEHHMTRKEFEQNQRIADLQRIIAEGGGTGDEMTLDQLNQHLDGLMKDGRIVTKDALKTEFTTREENYGKFFGDLVNTQARIAVRIPYLNAKHQQEFGEMFDPDEFLTKATEAKATNLDDFYKQYTAAKAETKRNQEVEAKIAAARAEERQKVLQETHMGPQGQVPVSDDGAEMGHFQAKLMGAKQGDDGKKSPVPEGAELGRGQIARAAARAGDRAEIEGRAA